MFKQEVITETENYLQFFAVYVSHPLVIFFVLTHIANNLHVMSQVEYKYIWSIEPAPSAVLRSTSSPPTQATTATTNVLSSLKNTKETYLEAVRILLVLLDNVLKYPNEIKYRSIRLENKSIKEKLLSLEGCSELLTAIGFKRSANEFTLPLDASLDLLRAYRDALIKRRDYWLNYNQEITSTG